MGSSLRFRRCLTKSLRCFQASDQKTSDNNSLRPPHEFLPLPEAISDLNHAQEVRTNTMSKVQSLREHRCIWFLALRSDRALDLKRSRPSFGLSTSAQTLLHIKAVRRLYPQLGQRWLQDISKLHIESCRVQLFLACRKLVNWCWHQPVPAHASN